ncbi:fch and double sh3 domains protein [Anaeramoeba flamelloides]|uniref:Fch and double sh3 domains protein n=1 Tax=Anaeramoeba flamelloides TaxID=1746091 RepID=A0ABQ8ZFM2_9EUKA|nr:fch and double sh3 domains protein [Anaeramoeba flamelloides]
MSKLLPLSNQLDLVEKRLNQGYQLLEEIKQFLSCQQELTSHHKKKLETIVPTTKEEYNMLDPLMNQIWAGILEHFSSLSTHSEERSKMLGKLFDELEGLTSHYKKKKEELLPCWKQEKQSLSKELTQLEKIKTEYNKQGLKLEESTLDLENYLLSEQPNPKEYNKLSLKRKPIKQKFQTLENEYKKSISSYNESQTNSQNKINKILHDVEQLEQDRISHLKTMMQNLTNYMLNYNKNNCLAIQQLTKLAETIDTHSILGEMIEKKSSKKPIINIPEKKIYQAKKSSKNNSKTKSTTTKQKTKSNIQTNPNKETVSNPRSPVSRSESNTKETTNNDNNQNLNTSTTINNKTVTKICKLRAVYSYKATEETELTFNEGDVLTILDKDESGWWSAQLGEETGFVPSTYFEENLESQNNQEKQDVNEQQQEVEMEQQQQTEEENTDTNIGDWVEAEWKFPGDGEGTLTMQVGELFQIIDIYEGWYLASNQNNEEGLIPSTYVKKY